MILKTMGMYRHLLGGSDGGYREVEAQAAHALTIRVRTAKRGHPLRRGRPNGWISHVLVPSRAELMGLLSVMVSLNALRELFPKRQKRVIPIEVFCDNQSSVDMIAH